MVVLLNCKNGEDPIKKEGARVLTRSYINFLDAKGQLSLQSVMESGLNLNSSKLLWLSLLPAKMMKIQANNEGARVLTTFLPL